MSLGGQWRPDGLPDGAARIFIAAARIVERIPGTPAQREERKRVFQAANSEAATRDWRTSRSPMRDMRVLLARHVLSQIPETRNERMELLARANETRDSREVTRILDAPQPTGALASAISSNEPEVFDGTQTLAPGDLLLNRPGETSDPMRFVGTSPTGRLRFEAEGGRPTGSGQRRSARTQAYVPGSRVLQGRTIQRGDRARASATQPTDGERFELGARVARRGDNETAYRVRGIGYGGMVSIAPAHIQPTASTSLETVVHRRELRRLGPLELPGDAGRSQPTQPETVHSPARSPGGRLRNVGAMTDENLRALAVEMWGSGRHDTEAVERINQEIRTRGRQRIPETFLLSGAGPPTSADSTTETFTAGQRIWVNGDAGRWPAVYVRPSASSPDRRAVIQERYDPSRYDGNGGLAQEREIPLELLSPREERVGDEMTSGASEATPGLGTSGYAVGQRVRATSNGLFVSAGAEYAVAHADLDQDGEVVLVDPDDPDDTIWARPSHLESAETADDAPSPDNDGATLVISHSRSHSAIATAIRRHETVRVDGPGQARTIIGKNVGPESSEHPPSQFPYIAIRMSGRQTQPYYTTGVWSAATYAKLSDEDARTAVADQQSGNDAGREVVLAPDGYGVVLHDHTELEVGTRVRLRGDVPTEYEIISSRTDSDGNVEARRVGGNDVDFIDPGDLEASDEQPNLSSNTPAEPGPITHEAAWRDTHWEPPNELALQAETMAQNIVSAFNTNPVLHDVLPEGASLAVRTPESGARSRIVLRRPGRAEETYAYVRPGPSRQRLSFGQRAQHQISFIHGSDQALGSALRPGQFRNRPAGAAHRLFTLDEQENAATVLANAIRSSRRRGAPDQVPSAPGSQPSVGVNGDARTAVADTRPGHVPLPGMMAKTHRRRTGWGEPPSGDMLPPRTGDERAFGIEIEMSGITFGNARAAMQRAGLPVDERSNYTLKNLAAFCACEDTSLDRGDPEIKFPPLSGEDGRIVMRRAVKALRDAGGRAGRQADYGLHVHIDARDMMEESKRLELADSYKNNRDLINTIVAPRRNRNDYWAREGYSRGHGHNELALNIGSPTIEFRRLGSNLVANDIEGWTTLMRCLVEYQKNHDGALPTQSSLLVLMQVLDVPIEAQEKILARVQRITPSEDEQ